MKIQHELILHKCAFFDLYLYLIWTVCNGFFLFVKLDYLRIPKLLLVLPYLLMVVTFSLKLCISQHRQFTFDMSKLTRFLLLTILIQAPLVSFYLISLPIQLSNPIEVCLNCFLLLFTLIESLVSFLVVYKSVKKTNQRPSLNSQSIELKSISRSVESTSLHSRSCHEEPNNPTSSRFVSR